MAEGEELGSNLLHVFHRTGTGRIGRNSCWVVGQAIGAKFAPSDRATS
jgi:hypothetical protein